MGIANAKNLKLDQEYEQYNNKVHLDEELTINQILFVEEEITKKKRYEKNTMETLTEQLSYLYNDNMKNLKNSKIKKIINEFEVIDWYSEMFAKIRQYHFPDKTNTEVNRNSYYKELFQIIENFYMITYLIIHYKLFETQKYELLNDFSNYRTSQNDFSNLMNRRKSSIGNISGFIDKSFMQDQSHLFNQRMLFENLQNPGNIKVKNQAKQSHIKTMHINKQSNYIEIIDIEEISKNARDIWTNGFVYKGIFFRLIRSKSLIDFLLEYVYQNSHKFYSTSQKEINLNCLFAVYSFFDQAIFVTPLVNTIKHEKTFILHSVVKNNIKQKLNLPNIDKLNIVSVLYYYSSFKKEENLYLFNQNFFHKEAFFDSLQLKYFLMFLKKFDSKKIEKKYIFNMNEIIFKKSTYFIFKIYNFENPSLKNIEDFADEVENHKSINFEYLFYLKKRYRIKSEFYPYIIQKLSKKKKKLLIIKMFVYLIEKNFRDSCLNNNTDTENVKIINSALFYKYFNKINYSIYNDAGSLYQHLLPYFLVLQLKAIVFFPHIRYVTDIKSMFDECHRVIYNNPFLYLNCLKMHFKITLNQDFMEKLRIYNFFIGSQNIIDGISMKVKRSFRPLRFMEYTIFQQLKIEGQFSSPVILIFSKNFNLEYYSDWLQQITGIFLTVQSPSNRFKKFIIVHNMILALFYLRVEEFDKSLKIMGNLTIFQNQKIIRFLHFLIKAIYYEIMIDARNSQNGLKSEIKNGNKLDLENLAYISYLKSLEIYMSLFGDPRWKSNLTDYFFELITTKLLKFEKDSTKKIFYGEILTSNFSNENLFFKYRNNMTVSGKSREDFENYQNISKNFKFIKNGKLNDDLLLELIDNAKIILIYNSSKIRYFLTNKNLIEEEYRILNNVFLWGYNNYGQLGFIPFVEQNEKKDKRKELFSSKSMKKLENQKMNKNFDERKFTLPRRMSNFNKNIIKISFGYDNCLALSEYGDVYSWGNNNYGKLGIGMDDLVLMPFPTKIRTLEKIEKILCGNNHSLVLDKNNHIWAWGSGTSGELGNGTFRNSIFPQKVVFKKKIGKIKKISLGACHSLILDDKGDLYGFGENKFCQILPDENTKNIAHPILIPLPLKIKKVASGESHNLALTENNQILVWGNAAYGQLGPLGKTTPIIKKPAILQLPFEPFKIFTGSLFSFIQSNQKNLYGFGVNENCELGIKTKEDIVWEPILIEKFNNQNIKKMVCGTNHVLCCVKSFTKTLFVWGNNKSMQLGVNLDLKNSEVLELQQFRNKNISDIACGGYHSGILIN
jgi:alpha-tubulin suppressor-like RCC1 family protein